MRTPKRKFIRPTSLDGFGTKNNEIVYLVYTYDSNRLSSEGPYDDQELAIVNMRKLLLNGICAWVVSYNA